MELDSKFFQDVRKKLGFVHGFKALGRPRNKQEQVEIKKEFNALKGRRVIFTII